jgi:Cystatin domain
MTLRTSFMALLVAVVAIPAWAGTAPAQVPAAAPATPSSNGYETVVTTDPDVQAAVKAAIADQRQKNRSDLKLISIVSAERQPVSGKNLRLCLSMDRTGSTQFARVVLSRNAKKTWSVTIWSWGSCGR